MCAYLSPCLEQAGTEVWQAYKVNILLWLFHTNEITGKVPQESTQRDINLNPYSLTLQDVPVYSHHNTVDLKQF